MKKKLKIQYNLNQLMAASSYVYLNNPQIRTHFHTEFDVIKTLHGMIKTTAYRNFSLVGSSMEDNWTTSESTAGLTISYNELENSKSSYIIDVSVTVNPLIGDYNMNVVCL